MTAGSLNANGLAIGSAIGSAEAMGIASNGNASAMTGTASAMTGVAATGMGSAIGIAGATGGGGGGGGALGRGGGAFGADGVGATLLRSEVQRSQNNAPSSFSK
jgi:hypothetical protein